MTRCIPRRMSHGVDVPHRTVRHQQSVFMIKIGSGAGCGIDCPLHRSPIVRMRPLENDFQGWFCRWVTSEDSERFVGPEDLPGGDIPSKAPGTAQSLRFSQIHFAMQQCVFNPLLILNRCLQVIS